MSKDEEYYVFGSDEELKSALCEKGRILTTLELEPEYVFLDTEMINPVRIGTFTDGDRPIHDDLTYCDGFTRWYDVYLEDDGTRIDEKGRVL